VYTPAYPGGGGEIFIEEIPETFSLTGSFPSDFPVESGGEHIASAGRTVIVEKIIEISAIRWPIILDEEFPEVLFLERIEHEYLFADTPAEVVIFFHECGESATGKLVGKTPACELEIESWRIKIESTVVKNNIQCLVRVTNTDCGVPEKRIKLVARRTGQKTDLGLRGERVRRGGEFPCDE
jgi:hypothetical protein